jgi:aminoglycoside/choline kinase family phosphotransferase
MEAIEMQIERLLYTIRPQGSTRIVKLPQSGSDRIYFRIYYNDVTLIATWNTHVQENRTFIYFSRHFKKLGLPVPEIYAVNEEYTTYIQEDLGTTSLLDVLEKQGQNEYVYSLFQQSITKLAQLQIKGHEGIDYSFCLTARVFGKQAILSDLLYFKYYFLDTLKLPYDKQAMLEDFESISSFLSEATYSYFMFRDFQSRNIIVHNNQVHFIDYQGGMQGALQYDIASLLWQARAGLSGEWKQNLLLHYIDEVNKLLPAAVDKELFIKRFNGYVLLRLLQVLGAYGFRGLFERKAHFLTSIPLALRNLQWFVLNQLQLGIEAPEFTRVLELIVKDDIICRFENVQATEATPLVVEVNSFSYKKGIPITTEGHGGGFVFDCRGLLNPGRYQEFKTSSGLDKNVQQFLEEHTRMNEFLNSVYNLVDISVEDYIQRGFESLMINFGCTGGQHRSVYAAEQTARHLKNKYKVKVLVKHHNQENWQKEKIEASIP